MSVHVHLRGFPPTGGDMKVRIVAGDWPKKNTWVSSPLSQAGKPAGKIANAFGWALLFAVLTACVWQVVRDRRFEPVPNDTEISDFR